MFCFFHCLLLLFCSYTMLMFRFVSDFTSGPHVANAIKQLQPQGRTLAVHLLYLLKHATRDYFTAVIAT